MQAPDDHSAPAEGVAPSKTEAYANAVIEALAKAAAEAGSPDINSALAALTFAQAYLIAKVRDRDQRRVAIRECDAGLRRETSRMVNERIVKEGLN